MEAKTITAKCKIVGHQKYDLGLVCLQKGCKKPRVLCMKCAITHGEHAQYYITLDELKKENNLQIEGWPIDQFGKQIKDAIKNLQKCDQSVELDATFDTYQKKINKEIDNVCQQIKKTLKQQTTEGEGDLQQKISNLFTEAFEIKSIKKIISERFFNGQISIENLSPELDLCIQNEESKQQLKQLRNLSREAQKFQYLSTEEFVKISERILQDIPPLVRAYRPETMKWKFQVSKQSNSSRIIVSEDGFCLQGSGSGSNQMFFSEIGFDKGIHGFTLEFQPFAEAPGYLYFGLVPESQRGTLSSFSTYPYKSLFGSSGSKIINSRGIDFTTTLRQGGRIYFILDLDLYQVYVRDEQQNTEYTNDGTYDLKGKKWAFILGFNGSAAKETLRLITSY